ncbi:MAG: GMP synthase subunit A [Halobacteriota archaeon]|nr:GMP synthase subunit A [Halobacteriota archaeon]
MHMTQILVFNNHGQFTHLILRSLRDMDIDAKLVSNELTVEDVISHEPEGLILSGGPSIDRTGNSDIFINEIELPILGICLGHQLIAKTLGGKVNIGSQGGYAQIEIEILEEGDIFKGLGEKMLVWSSHSDEVIGMPPGFILLARSKHCEIEAMKHEKLPIYGVQFHPEVSHTNDGEQILLNFLKVCEDYKS